MPHKSGPDVLVGVSTLGDRLDALRLPPARAGVGYLVGHQLPELGTGAGLERPDVSVLPLVGTGLSRSRNALLRAAAERGARWLVVCDDDVTLDLDVLLATVARADAEDVAVAAYHHRFTDGRTTLPTGAVPHDVTSRTLGSISSVDLALRPDVLLAAGVHFDETFGLGTDLPSGEEAVLVADALRAGLRVRRYPVEVATHPPLTSGLDFSSSPELVRAKRAMLRRVLGPLALPGTWVWWARKLPEARAAGHAGTLTRGLLLPDSALRRRRSGPRRVVLSGVRSVSHLLYAASWLRCALDEGRPVELTVLDTGTFLGEARVRPEDVTAYLPEDPALTVLLAPPDADPGPLLASGATLLCIGAPSLRAVRSALRAGGGLPETVVVDEGIGSYGDWRTRRAAALREGGNPARSTLRALARDGSSTVLRATRWPLYVPEGDTWRVRPEAARAFLDHVGGVDPAPGTVVYLTQPWPELGVVGEEEHLAHLRAVRAASESVGLRLVLRPHPAENPTRYTGFDVSTGTGPAELDRAVLGADAVLGASSTALLNVAALFGVRALRVADPGWTVLESGLGPAQRSLLDAFLPPAVEVGELAGQLAETV